MLHLIEYTFLNKDTEQPFADFLVEIYAAKSSAPLRLYRDAQGKQLISPIGQVITSSEGTIRAYAPACPQYELVLSNRTNRLILDKVSVVGVSATEGSSPLQLSETEVQAVRDFLTGGTPGSGTVTSVNASGGTTGLTFSGGPITGSGTLTLAGVTNISHGGSGETTAENAFNAFAPTTTKGDIIVFDGVTNVRLPVGTDGQVLTADSSVDEGVSFQDPAGGGGPSVLPDGDYGDITASSSGTVLTIDSNAVTNTKLADMAESTIKGRAAGAGSGDPTDLTAAQIRTLINVANGATANSADATLLARSNHTGTQTASTISDFSEAVDDRVGALVTQGTNVTVSYDDSAGTLTISAANTNLTSTPGASNVVIASDTGNDATILAATTSAAGAMSAADKTKLDSIASGATANSSDATLLARANHTGTQAASTISDFSEAVDDRVAALVQQGTNVTVSYNDSSNTLTISAAGTDLTSSTSTTTVTVISNTGADATLAAATGSAAGVMTSADKTKLDGIANGATANSADATLLARANHTGTQAASTISDFSEAVDDRVNALLVEGSNITLTYDDSANTLTIAATTGGSGSTDLDSVPDATTVTITSSSGDSAVILAATTSDAGVMSASDKTKLDGIANGATANSSDATLLARANHTGTQTASTISDFSEAVDDRVAALVVQGTNVTVSYNDGANSLTISAAGTDLVATPSSTDVALTSSTGSDTTIPGATTSDAGVMSAADKTKLNGIASGATANSSDATLLARANHTGTQTASTISDFSEAVDDRVAALVQQGTGISVSYNDGANTLTIATTGVFVTDGDKGDIVVSSTGTAWNIDSGVITAAARTVLDDATTGDMLTTLGGQPLDGTLTALAGVTFAANKGLYSTGADAFSTFDLTAGGRALSGVAGTADTFPYFSASNTVTLATLTAAGLSLLADADATAQRATLGVEIGVDVQEYSAALDQVAALGDPGADRIVFWDESDNAFKYLQIGTNLSITGTTLNASGGGGGGLADGDYGDVTVSGTGTVITIDSGVVTNAKLANSSITIAGDSGSDAVSLGETLTFDGDATQGVSTSSASNTVSITVADATTTTKGVASFDDTSFSVASGVVSLDIVDVAHGGTGATSFTATQVLLGNGTSAVTSSANLTFSGSTLTINGLQIIGGLSKSITSASGGITLTPATGADLVINTTGKLRSNLSQVLQLDGNGNGITLTPGSTNDLTVVLDSGTTAKVAISGPTASNYASGLGANDLTNKQYVDDTATAAVATALADASLSQLAINEQTGSYTLVLGDAGKQIDMNVGSGNNLTIPLNSTVAFPLNTVIFVHQMGAGATTIVATGGVTIDKPASKTLTLLERYEVVTLHKKGTDTWRVSGGLAIA